MTRRAKTRSGGSKRAPRAPVRRTASGSQIARKRRMTRVLDRLDKVLGEIRTADAGPLLERAVYLILREGSSDASARRGLKVLQEEFVDWNEVRASRPAELARMLAGSGRSTSLRRYVERARRVREMIDQVYNERNETSLEFLVERPFREQLEYLEELEDLGRHNAHALMQWGSTPDKLPTLSPEAVRAAARLGLVSSGGLTQARKDLLAITDPTRLVAAVAHLTCLGFMEEEWPPSLKDCLV